MAEVERKIHELMLWRDYGIIYGEWIEGIDDLGSYWYRTRDEMREMKGKWRSFLSVQMVRGIPLTFCCKN